MVSGQHQVGAPTADDSSQHCSLHCEGLEGISHDVFHELEKDVAVAHKASKPLLSIFCGAPLVFALTSSRTSARRLTMVKKRSSSTTSTWRPPRFTVVQHGLSRVEFIIPLCSTMKVLFFYVFPNDMLDRIVVRAANFFSGVKDIIWIKNMFNLGKKLNHFRTKLFL